MSKPLSNSQIAKLGDRLRDGTYSAEDLLLLSEYRASFAPALAKVVEGIRSIGTVELTERPEKSLKSIIYKLQRLSTTKLDQIRDIAGCRIVVANIAEQRRYAAQALKLFPGCRLLDLREKPHSGYRAVHLEIRTPGRRVEVQIRTELQDLWAQCSEQWALASHDVAIKYGGGPAEIRNALLAFSEVVRQLENRPELSGSAPFYDSTVEQVEADLRSSMLRFKLHADPNASPFGA